MAETRRAFRDITNHAGGPEAPGPDAKRRARLKGFDAKEEAVERRRSSPPLCEGYIEDIMQTLYHNEGVYKVDADYLTRAKSDVTGAMRAVLSDWLIDVGEEYRLHQETLHLSLNYLDRFLSIRSVDRSKLQLVGVGCLLLAAKLEETYPPDVDEFVFIADYTYSRQEVIQMESMIIDALEFKLVVATKLPFLHRLLLSCGHDDVVVHLSAFLADLSLLSYTLVGYLPSLLAASCLFAARRAIGLAGWDDHLAAISGFTAEEVVVPARELVSQWRTSLSPLCKLNAIRVKYSSSRHACLRSISPPSSL